jgi:ribose/xylose/arabinose/galactoside ABC-type transport system permease subunit
MAGKNNLRINLKSVYDFSTIFVLLVVMIFFAVANKIITGYDYLSVSNIATIINQASFLAVIGMAQMLTILVVGINLSIGSVMAFSAMLCGPLLLESSSYSPLLGPLAMIGISALIGLLNGVLNTKLKIPSFIATFGTMFIFRGLAWIIAGNTVHFRIKPEIRFLAQGQILSIGRFTINMSIIVCIIVVILLTFLLKKTTLGRKIYFSGSNPVAAEFSGISVDKIVIITFIIAGALYGFCGVLYTAKVNACDASMYTGSHFDAVSVALLGGVSLAGGSGNVWGCAIGALIVSAIQNGLNTLQVPSEYQTLVLGVLIILSVFFNDWLTNKKMDITSENDLISRKEKDVSHA